ncbi:receptor like protein 23-like [Salvia miltiorrhiza]|uniref:receptor like protein 23-like n=1 Tax=Salvia miltiorrhiza TaxID=226208 RepID=UPI0025AD79C9|nr:receptor like protein 23-like [Salvia miltiorrhiza]
MAISLLLQFLFIILLPQSIAKTHVTDHAQTHCIEHEKNLLLELKNQLVFNSSYSTNLVQWNVDETGDCCSWQGVGCDDAGHVISLWLKDEAISGGFNESSSLFNLKFLKKLSLSNNLFSSSLPHSITNLESLSHLYLSNATFSGTIPLALGNLTRLVHVDLSGNFFSGAIPLALGNLTRLVHVDLSHNFFSGSISSIHFEGLYKIDTIDLSYNSLSGSIPKSISTLFSSLWQLDLHNNQFHGQLSEFLDEDISKLHSFHDLDLSNNLLNDTFQLEKILTIIPYLENLDLSNNFLSLNTSSSNKFSMNKSFLNYLDLSSNKIGEVPSWIWEIGELTFSYLNLSCNKLVDLQQPYNIPSFSLGVLDLHSNQLRGELPLPPRKALYVDYSNNYFHNSSPNTGSFSSVDLQFLSVANNSLTGPFPTFICNSTSLKFLDLSFNNLSGSLPSCLFENDKNLQVLKLGRNNINGGIPDKFSPNCSLRTLDVSHNNLVGDVPLSLKSCSSLAFLNVGSNHIDGNFPCLLPSSLQVLVLRSNRLHGEIGCQKSWPNLQIMDIASNNFSGSLHPFNFTSWGGMVLEGETRPARFKLGTGMTNYTSYNYWDEVTLTIKGLELKLVKIWPEFTSIDFSCNNFHGDIPKAIGELSSLYLLNLSHNALSGSIPKSFGELRQLGSLDLSMNLLTGEIPDEIARLTFLVVMNVSYNKLVGKIPLGSQIQTFSADSFEGNIGLCGLPLSISCTNTPPQRNVESDREIEWDYVFAAAGYAVGIGSFSWVLLFWTSFRDKYFEKVEDVFEKIFERRQNRKRRHGGRRAVRNQVRRQ